jgi:hypothetical protein
MRTTRRIVVAVTLAVAAPGCETKPACTTGKLGAEWDKAPLKVLVPAEATVCEVPAAEAATHAQFWVKDRVHRANLDSVDRAQNNGWDRTSDNWYDTKGDFDTPKWSEFVSKDGKLRVDVKEAGGGSLVDVKYTPGG